MVSGSSLGCLQICGEKVVESFSLSSWLRNRTEKSIASSKEVTIIRNSSDFAMADEATQYTFEVKSTAETYVQNNSFADECQNLIFSEMEYLPWDNPNNIVSAEVEKTTRRVKDTMLVLLFLIGGPGNVINMAVFYKQGLQDRVNLCLFALSLADEMYLVMAMFHHAEQVHIQFTTKETYGPLYTFFVNNRFTGLLGIVYASQILSSIVASERCLCVLSPLKFQTLMRTRTMAAIIIAVYLLTVGLYTVVAFRFHIGCLYDPVSDTLIESFVMGEFYRRHKQLIDHLDSVVLGAGLPAVVMILVITATVITIVKLRQIVTWRAGTSSSLSPREVALTKMLVGTSILFTVCTFPFSVARISRLVLPEMNAGRRYQNFYLTTLWISELFAHVNSSFNIFVYYVMGSRYRDVFWELLRRKPARKNT